MPNGDCPVGARNSENIKTLFRQQERTDERVQRIEDCAERTLLAVERNKWQIGLIVGLMLTAGNVVLRLLGV